MALDRAYIKDNELMIRESSESASTSTWTSDAMYVGASDEVLKLILDDLTIDADDEDERYIVTLEESDESGGTYTDVPGAYLDLDASELTGSPIAFDEGYEFEFVARKDYIKCKITMSGTSPSFEGNIYVHPAI